MVHKAKNTTCIWYQHEAEAARFDTSLFPDSEVKDAFSEQPIRLGAGLGAPDRFVLVQEAENVVMRIELYRQRDEYHCFEAAEIWQDFVVIGIGERVHLIHLKTRKVTEHCLGSYFGHLYPADSAVYVTSAERAFKIGPEGKVLWASDLLGIDGVLIHEINSTTVLGEGEWDPPGGWRPFTISTQTGRRGRAADLGRQLP